MDWPLIRKPKGKYEMSSLRKVAVQVDWSVFRTPEGKHEMST